MPDRVLVASTVGKAAVRGLFCYAVCGFLYLHIFVVQEWAHFDDSNYTRQVEVNLPKHTDDVESIFGLIPDFPRSEEIEELVQDIRALPQHKQQQMPLVGSVLKDYQATLAKWKELSPSNLLRDGTESIGRLKLTNLLQQSSLENMEFNEMTTLFKFALADLQRLVDDKKQLRWSTVKNIFSPDTPFPEKDKLSSDELFHMVCQSEILAMKVDDEDDTAAVATDDMEEEELAKLLALYAQEEDLASYLASVEDLLERLQKEPQKKCQQFSNVSDALSEGVKALDQQRRVAIGNIEESIEEENEDTARHLEEQRQQQDDDDDEDTVACEGATTGNDVEELLDAGLNALARHQDMRAALVEVLKDVDPDSAENLILDADFHIEATRPATKSPDAVRLRQLVDSPLLSNMATPIDWFLDVISGYYDPLDHRIDQLTERVVDHSNNDLSSLGRVFVTKLWYWSGQLAVPLPRPIRESLEKSPRGRALLESIS